MKNKLFTTLTLLCLGTTSIAQIGIGTDNPNDAAILEIKSTDKGILLPRLESSKISSLDNVQGLMVYCTDCDDSKGVLKINNGSEWVNYIPTSGGTIVNEDINPDAKIDGSKIVPDFGDQDISTNGNVGIGTTEPGLQYFINLVVGNNDPGDKGITIRSNSSNVGVLAFSDTDLENCGRYSGYISYKHSHDSMHFYTNCGIERMRIDANGYVGVGTNNPQYKLHVEGGVNATNHYSSSDERWKKEIKTLDNSLNKITALRGVSYDWNHDEFPEKDFSEGTQIGVIAQEIESVFPELVHTDKDGYKSVSYSNLVAPLIEAIKELKQQNENFRIRIESLEAQLKN